MALSPEEQAELDSLKSMSAAPEREEPKGLTPEEQRELDELSAMASDQAGLPGDSLKSEGWSKAMPYIGKALDYTGGLTRTGVYSPANLFTKDPVVKKEDVLSAFAGEAQPSRTFQERAGVPPVVAAWTGPISDIALDVPYLGLAARAVKPVSKWGRGLQTAAKIGTAPLSEASKGMGRKTYDWAFNKINRHLDDFGKKPLSEVLWENGRVAGTAKSVESQMMDLAGKMKSARDQILVEAEAAGAMINNADATKLASDYVLGLREYPRFEGGNVADSLDELVSAYSSKAPVTPGKANKWKMDLYDAAGDKAYKIGSKPSEEKELLQKLGEGYKNQLEMQTNATLAGKGDELSRLNEDLGSILTAQRPVDREVKSALTKNPITPVDALAVGGSWALKQDPAIAATIFAGKKAADLAKTTWAKTKAGKLMYKTGESMLPDALARQASVWSLRPQKEER